MAVDLFAKSIPLQPQAMPTTGAVSNTAGSSLGSVLAAVLRDNPAVQKQMTAAEQSAVSAVIKNVGTPDEYGSAAEYVLRALPYVRSAYAAMDVVAPLMPSREEVSILMRDRFLSASPEKSA